MQSPKSVSQFGGHKIIVTIAAVVRMLLIITLTSGICRRVAVAAMSLLHESENEAAPSQQFSLHTVNDAFLAISASHPTLMVQWCNILILLNYGDQSWWSQLLQTPQMQMSSVSSYVCLYIEQTVFPVSS